MSNPHDPARMDFFTYDALGNRAGANHLANRGWMTFARKDNGLNQYRAWWNYSIINYDDDIGNGWGSPGAANGVLMQDGNITAGFNALNQPMYIWSANVGWTYFGYDSLGRCVKRWRDGGPATYLYYDGWNLIQEGSQSWSAERLYIYGARADEMVAQIKPGAGAMRYFHADANGNYIMQTDGSCTITEQYEYDAFGYPYFYDAIGTNLGYSPWGNRFLFTGREWLSDLKLYDYRNRLYQPELGRFLQPDPKEFGAGDYNLYRYCHNDPVNHQDPSGLGKISFFVKAGKFLWKKIGKEQAERALKKGANVMVEGPGASKEGRNLARKEFGEKTVRHDPHGDGQMPHYQHKNGGGPHVFYKALTLVTGVGLLGDNALGNTIDFFNPVSDVKDIIDLVNEIPQRQMEPRPSRLQIELAP